MLIELGNHAPAFPGPDDRPKVTHINMPEFDEEFLSHTPGHYSHDHKGLTVEQFKTHRQDALDYNQGITHLPDHEAVLAATAAWSARSLGRPAWVKCTDHPEPGLTPKGRAAELEKFLSEFYECPTLNGKYGDCDDQAAHIHKELDYWTVGGAPGEFHSATLPDLKALYTVDGRIMSNNNDGGSQLTGTIGVGTAAAAQSLTTTSTLTSGQYVGSRIIVYSTTSNNMVWGNITANPGGASTVLSVDQWYTFATPGGTAGTTPTTPWAWCIPDGGMVSTWFAALATGAGSLLNTDHTLAVASGNVEYVQGGGTLNRKICPIATDVSASARTVTLVPVFTANGSDSLPKVFTAAGFFASMVVAFGAAAGPMKFEDAVSPSATLAASGDNVTLTETISGS